MKLVFSRPPSALERLRGSAWHCASCRETHRGLFDLAAWSPDFWDGPETYEPNSGLRMEGDFLSEDFCVIGGDSFFVRGVVLIPVHGLEQPFGFGIWSTLSRRNFDLYLEGFDDGAYPDWGPWTSWFSTDIPYFGTTLREPARLRPRPDRQRPLVWLNDDDHPLSVAQREGISPQTVMDLYAAYGHTQG